MSPEQPDSPSGTVNVQVQRGVGAGGDIVNSTIHVGLDANETGQMVRDAVHPVLHLTRFEARTARAAENNSDASLLSAYRTDVVPLLGRDAILDDLKRWTASKRDISIRVLTGGAGRGKTRLALELARELGNGGWLAGFATDEALDRFRKHARVADWTWKAPTLVVIDYAAGRANQVRDWIGELVDRTSDKPLRLLLLERQASLKIGWLSTVLGSGADDRSRAARALLDPCEPIEPPEIDDPAMRQAIFASLASRRKTSPVPPSGHDPEFDRRLRDEKWAGDPLFLMMAGLVAAETGVSNALALNRTDLATMIAQRELDRIGRIAASRGVDANDQRHPGFAVRHMAVLATLAQGLALADARKLAQQELDVLGSSAGLNNVIDALRNALPSGGNAAIAPILPDIIGEAAILIWLGNAGVLSNLGTEPLTCVRRIAGAARSRVSQTLVRTAQDFAAAGRDEPVRWLESLSQTTDADLGALMDIANELPAETLGLRELATDLTQQIAARLRARLAERTEEAPDEPGQANLAGSLNNLSVRLSDLGRREEALAASQESVDIRRRLAQSRPDAFLPDLAISLNNLGVMLSNLGRREEALAASQETVDIRRRLAQSSPDTFLPKLAMSLNNISVDLSNLGRREEALAASQEAVSIYRRLAQSRPDAFLPDLATSLNNLGIRLSNLGRHEEALAASQEAVDIRRRLAQSRPDAFLPDLARSISVHSDVLAALDRHEEAARAAVDVLRMLLPYVRRYPKTYGGLARTVVADVKRYSDAAGQVCDESLLEQAAQLLPPDEE